MHPRTTRVAATAFVTALGFALIVGCDGSNPVARPTSTTAETGSATSSGQSTTSTTSPTTTSPKPKPTPSPTPKPKFNIIDWILNLGVGAPPGPADDLTAAYRKLVDGDCKGALDATAGLDEPSEARLITGAARACLAAFQGRGELWDEAEELRDSVDPGDLANCFEAAAWTLLDRLVSAHEEHPERVFKRVKSGEASEPPCTEVQRLEPSHGAEAAAVRIKGRQLQRVTGVSLFFPDSVDGAPIDFERVGRDLQIDIPDPEGARVVCVVVITEPANWPIGGLLFEYDEPEPGDGAASPSNEMKCPPD